MLKVYQNNRLPFIAIAFLCAVGADRLPVRKAFRQIARFGSLALGGGIAIDWMRPMGRLPAKPQKRAKEQEPVAPIDRFSRSAADFKASRLKTSWLGIGYENNYAFDRKNLAALEETHVARLNCDSFEVDRTEKGALFVSVADGCGGGLSPHGCARLVCQTFNTTLSTGLETDLKEAVIAAHRMAVQADTPPRGEYSRSAATFAGCRVEKGVLSAVGIGDCGIFLIRERSVQKLPTNPDGCKHCGCAVNCVGSPEHQDPFAEDASLAPGEERRYAFCGQGYAPGAVEEVKLEAGDLVMLVTDGVLDNLARGSGTSGTLQVAVLQGIVTALREVTPGSLMSAVMDHVRDNLKKRDHTTCVVFPVDQFMGD